MAHRLITAALVAIMVLMGSRPACSNVTDQGDYVVVKLPSTFRMRVEHRRGLVTPSSFARLGDVVVNGQFFETESGCTMGTTRSEGRTVADDGRRNGRGLVWNEGPDWQLVDSRLVSRAANGIQVGPTLLEGGRSVSRVEVERVRPNAYGRARRIGLARSDSGGTFLVATRAGYTLAEFATLLARLGASEAIGFDGGASTSLYVGGREYVDPGRRIPSALVIDFGRSHTRPALAARRASAPSSRRPAAPTPAAGLVGVLVPQPFEGRVQWLRRTGGSLAQQVEALGADVVVCSPDLFCPGDPRPVGALRSGGRPVGDHPGPAAGYTWALDASRRQLLLQKCYRRHLASGTVGGCGPLLLQEGRVVSTLDQGFTREGGLFAPARRLALALDRSGRLVLVGSNHRLGVEEFAILLRDAGYRYSVGLSGGDHALLYCQGRWIMRPAPGALPPHYLFVFPGRSAR